MISNGVGICFKEEMKKREFTIANLLKVGHGNKDKLLKIKAIDESTL